MLKRTVAAVAATLALGAGSVPALAAVTPPAPGSTQVAGADRYGTAVAVSRKTFAPGTGDHTVDLAVVATGADFPDGLAGASVAGNIMGPLLLTPKTGLRADVRAELVRIKPRAVLITGGTGVVSPAVESAIRAALPGATVFRAAGSSRYDTAARVSAEMYSDGAGTIFVASGRGYADAVSGSSAAALTAAPMLLADTTLPAPTRAELARLNAKGILVNVVVLGGPGAVSEPVFRQIDALVGKRKDGTPKAVRISGADRYATAATLAGVLWGGTQPPAKRAYYVNGTTWPDALAAGPAAAANDAPVLLTSRACMPVATKAWDARTTPTLGSRVWVGGTGVVAATTRGC